MTTERKNIEYVIYCRKSTDDSTDRQMQSIPDQISYCIDYAMKNNLTIKEKPRNFTDFETIEEIKKEDLDKDNAELYQKYRNLFIIKEHKSGKTPGIRNKWRRLASMIKQWHIKWLLSYSPDRQARNMLEWGELINLVDENLVDLKYTNFNFENTADWKMMLGIWFVFSKQYSDKLSQDSKRGSHSKAQKWKALWYPRYWYFINDEGYHEPDPEMFEPMKEAFRMKVYEWKSDKYITDWLIQNWVKRIVWWNKKENKEKIKEVYPNDKTIYKIWIDPFYYGVWQYWETSTDLRELNKYYKPIITEEEWKILMERYEWNQPKLVKKERKKENLSFYPLDEEMVKTDDNKYTFTPNLPNKKRFREKLKKLQETKPNAILGDVIESHQINFRVTSKDSEYYKFSIGFNEIESTIIDKLKSFKITDEIYEHFKNEVIRKSKMKDEEITTERSRLQLYLNKVNSDFKKHIEKFGGGVSLEKAEQKVYLDWKSNFELKIETIEDKIKTLRQSERNVILEANSFAYALRNADKYYKKATFVQKRKIASLLFSNIKINRQKRVRITVRSGLKSLFSNIGRTCKADEKNLSSYLKAYLRI